MRRFTRLTNEFSKKFENHPSDRVVLLSLQLLSRSQDAPCDAGDGSGSCRPRLDAGRVMRFTTGAEAQRAGRQRDDYKGARKVRLRGLLISA